MYQYKRFLICREINHSFFCRNLGGSALIINALPLPKFLQKRFPLLFPWCICSIVYMEQSRLNVFWGPGPAELMGPLPPLFLPSLQSPLPFSPLLSPPYPLLPSL